MITPTKDRIVILQDEAKPTSTIIETPDSDKKPNRGIVHAISETSELSVGDSVVFGKFGHTEVKDPETGIPYLVMDETSVIAVLS